MWYNISIHTTVTVLLTEVNGEEKEYRILFTDIADTEFIEAITNYVTQLTDKEINGILLENSISYPKENFWLLLVKGFAFIILLITVLVLILVIHRKKKELKMTLEVDSLTETTNIAGLESVYRQIINRHNYVLYQAIYFRIELHKLSEKCTRKEIEDVLKGTASILKAHEYSSDVFIRAKDDGFLMLKMCVNDIELEKYVDMVIDNVHALISAYANTSTDYCYAGVYKISSFSEHIKDIAHLAEQTCMFAAKRNLRIAYFSQGLISSLKEEKELLNSIEDAIKQEEIKLYLHFFVDPRTDTIVGAEALSRWHHTIKGVLLPDKFIHVLEREGKAPVLDYYILGKTCALLEKLYSQGIDDFFVSFNLSRATLESDGFVQIVKSIINNYNFRHDSLILELTESFLQRDIELIYENLSEIKKEGVRIVIDNFGSGYSCFEDLFKYDFDGLKVDKMLIDNLCEGRGRAVIKGIIAIGHDLGMTVFGEGVETLEEVETLIKLDCDAAQGYYYYYPLPVDEAMKIYMKQRKETA